MGITPFAKQQLGEIILMEWPHEGDYVRENQSIGTLESAKTVVDLYSPVEGIVVKLNPDLKEDVTMINEDPLNKGWIAVLQVKSNQLLYSFLTEEEYQTWIGEEE